MANNRNIRRAKLKWLHRHGVLERQDRQDHLTIQGIHRTIRSKSATKTDGKSFRHHRVNSQFRGGSRLNDPPFHTGPCWLRKGVA